MILNVSIALIATQVLPFLTIYGGTLALIACVILRYRLALSETLHSTTQLDPNKNTGRMKMWRCANQKFRRKKKQQQQKQQHETWLRSSMKCETTVEIFASLKRQ